MAENIGDSGKGKGNSSGAGKQNNFGNLDLLGSIDNIGGNVKDVSAGQDLQFAAGEENRFFLDAYAPKEAAQPPKAEKAEPVAVAENTENAGHLDLTTGKLELSSPEVNHAREAKDTKDTTVAVNDSAKIEESAPESKSKDPVQRVAEYSNAAHNSLLNLRERMRS